MVLSGAAILGGRRQTGHLSGHAEEVGPLRPHFCKEREKRGTLEFLLHGSGSPVLSVSRVSLSQPLRIPGGAGPGPRHPGAKMSNALNRLTIKSNMNRPGKNETCPTIVPAMSAEATPTTVATKEVLRQAPIPPAITARLWSTSQKVLPGAEGHVLPRLLRIESPDLVRTRSNPATPAATIRMHASASTFRKPKPGIAIPNTSLNQLCRNITITPTTGIPDPMSND